MVSIENLNWIAGLLEGEGCFHAKKKYSYPLVTCAMTDEDVILRLQNLLGGTVYIKTPDPHGTYKTVYRWEMQGGKAAGVMMTLYPFLFFRRQAKIREILTAWRERKKHRTRQCRRGHQFTAETTTYGSMKKSGQRYYYRLCRICAKERGDLRIANKIGDPEIQKMVLEDGPGRSPFKGNKSAQREKAAF